MGWRTALPVASIAAMLAAAPVPGRAQPERTASDLAAALQQKYDGVRDFSADFVQRYRGGVLRREAVERGTVIVKKPGRMRWEYEAPERKLFVSDGETFYSYLPDDRQVIVSALPEGASASTPALFLAGRGNLTRDFVVTFTDTPAGLALDTRSLELVPKTPQADYETLVLSVDPDTLALRGLVALDLQGGTSSFIFSNLKENVGFADRLFTFDVPRGVDVIRDRGAP